MARRKFNALSDIQLEDALVAALYGGHEFAESYRRITMMVPAFMRMDIQKPANAKLLRQVRALLIERADEVMPDDALHGLRGGMQLATKAICEANGNMDLYLYAASQWRWGYKELAKLKWIDATQDVHVSKSGLIDALELAIISHKATLQAGVKPVPHAAELAAYGDVHRGNHKVLAEATIAYLTGLAAEPLPVSRYSEESDRQENLAGARREISRFQRARIFTAVRRS